MNKFDLLAESYYNAFNRRRTRANMDELLERAAGKGPDVFDPKVIERSIQHQDYIYSILMEGILEAARRRYRLPPELEVKVLLRDRDDFNANIEQEAEAGHSYVLFVDDLMATALFKLVNVLLYWNAVVSDEGEWARCFRYTLYALTEYGHKRIRPASPPWVHRTDLDMVNGQLVSTHLLADVNMVINAFILAHELGHLALGHLGIAKRTLAHEFAADDFAYQLVLSMIQEQSLSIAANGKRPEIDLYSEYTYLAPLMFFDLMELIDSFCKKVYNNSAFSAAAEQLRSRKAHLESWVYDSPDHYAVETHDGNRVYNAFLNSVDRFTEALDAKIRMGKSVIPDGESIPHAVATAGEEKEGGE